MLSYISLAVLCFSLTLASPARREKRQLSVNCIDPFQNVPNPCVNNPSNRIYFPHPTDNTKFLQCDLYGRMYIIQCPMNEVYDPATTACGGRTPQTTARPTPPPVVVTQPVTKPPQVVLSGNPCTAENIARGQIYFAYAQNKYRFIECDMLGNANVLACPTGLIWEQSRLSCVYDFSGGKPATGSGSGTGSGTGINTGSGSGIGAGTGTGGPTNAGALPSGMKNPCTPQSISNDDLFHPHPDSHRFIQCDLWGDANVMVCPTGLVWNDYSKTCASPYVNIGAPPSA